MRCGFNKFLQAIGFALMDIDCILFSPLLAADVYCLEDFSF